ncbi:MAG TPA: acetylglutamate kinase [Gemmatimonadaceae bacterium]
MTRVIKIGGRPQQDAALAVTLARDWARSRLNGGLVVVHGGGAEISELQATLGGASKFVDGRRATTQRDIGVVRMALSGSANKRLASTLVDHGVDAVGLSGEDAALIGALPLNPSELGCVGVPKTINVTLLRHLLDAGYLPVISPLSRDLSGTMGAALNVNGDDAAAAIAVALHATELLLVTDVPGIMCDGALVPRLRSDTAAQLIADRTVTGGMRAKVDAGLAAIAGGVPRVRISDVESIADHGRGTVLYATGERS